MAECHRKDLVFEAIVDGVRNADDERRDEELGAEERRNRVVEGEGEEGCKSWTHLALCNQLKATFGALKHELKRSRREERFWRKRLKSVEKKFERSVKSVKRRRWCVVCRGVAHKQYKCCTKGYYCGFVHRLGHKLHFIDCQNKKPKKTVKAFVRQPFRRMRGK